MPLWPLLLAAAAPAQTDFVPSLKSPCIDWIATGGMAEDGYTDQTGPDDLIGHGTFFYKIVQGRSIWHGEDFASISLDFFGHTGRVFPGYPVIFRGKTSDGDWRSAIVDEMRFDRKGRGFIPIRRPVNPEMRDFDWRPAGYEAFLRPVAWTTPKRRNVGPDDVVPGYTEIRHGRVVVLNGIYVEDLPRMFEGVKPGECGR